MGSVSIDHETCPPEKNAHWFGRNTHRLSRLCDWRKETSKIITGQIKLLLLWLSHTCICKKPNLAWIKMRVFGDLIYSQHCWFSLKPFGIWHRVVWQVVATVRNIFRAGGSKLFRHVSNYIAVDMAKNPWRLALLSSSLFAYLRLKIIPFKSRNF